MGRNKLKLIASAIVLAGSGLSLILYYWVTPPFDPRSHEAMGQVAAEDRSLYEQAAAELMKEIQEAKEALRKKGMKMD